MSQHIYKTKNAEGQNLTITLGYDRPLDFVFCTIMSQDDAVIYSNLDDDGAGTDQQDANYYRRILEQLGLHVPESVFREVISDQTRRMGNRVEIHGSDEPLV